MVRLMTEVEELYEAAKLALKRWGKPVRPGDPVPKPWQEMLDRPYGKVDNDCK